MFQHLVVPIDGSAASWGAVPVAARMAAAVDGRLDVVSVVDRLADIAPARTELIRGLEQLGDLPVSPAEQVLASDVVGAALAEHVESLDGATVVMSSHGHGRSAAVLGSIADEVLRKMFGPIVILGPHVDPESAGRLDGTYVVPLDGSDAGETILPVAEAWAIEFGAVPWLVEVVGPGPHGGPDVFESSYTSRLAATLRERSGREVEFEVLHGDNPAASVVDFARSTRASLVFATTHGRTGLERLRLGSVAAEIVRRSPCPVVLHRPPHRPG